MKNATKQLSGKAAGAVGALIVAALVALGAISPQAADHSSGAGQASSGATAQQTVQQADVTYKFRSNRLLKEHYRKHGEAMGFADAQAYVAGANAVVANPNTLHKTQREDGDDVYYLQSTDELVIVSSDGYIRTYFNPGGIDYYNRQ